MASAAWVLAMGVLSESAAGGGGVVDYVVACAGEPRAGAAAGLDGSGADHGWAERGGVWADRGWAGWGGDMGCGWAWGGGAGGFFVCGGAVSGSDVAAGAVSF